MSKKTIILFLIALLILNTLFWINLLVQRIPKFKPISLGEPLIKEWKPLRELEENLKKDIDELFGGNDKKIQAYTYGERLEKALRSWKLSKGAITLLIITDAVLIAISFMIILLYKKD